MVMEDKNDSTVTDALYWDSGHHDRPEIVLNDGSGGLTTGSSTSNRNLSDQSNRLLVTKNDHDDNLNIAEQVLTACGDILTEANEALDEVDEDMLGSAIQRGCTDLANVIGNLALQLESQSDDERRDLAQACLQDVRSAAALVAAAEQEHDLLLQHLPPDSNASPAAPSLAEWQNQQQQQLHESFATMNESQLVQAIAAAGCFLRDVEDTLRAVEREEAQELADVALTAARIFVTSLQSMHAQLCPQDLLMGSSRSCGGPVGLDAGGSSSSVRIELLDDDDADADDENDGTTNEKAAKGNADTNNRNPQAKNKHRKQKMDRLRVLWPPLGPAVSQALSRGKEAALSLHPLLSMALAMILWPAAVTTAIVGTPLVLVDGFIQDIYSNFQDAPLVVGLERGAAQVFHTGRLALVTGKVVSRHSLRVVQRQIHRNGGLGHIATSAAGMAVDRILHPMESIGWSVDQIKRLLQHFTDQELDKTLQVLQQ
jgi:hypothetical protein